MQLDSEDFKDEMQHFRQLARLQQKAFSVDFRIVKTNQLPFKLPFNGTQGDEDLCLLAQTVASKG